MSELSAPPDQGQMVRELMAALINQGRFADAAEVLDSLAGALPDDPQLKVYESYVHLKLGRNEQAIQCVSQALALGSGDPLTLLVLGAASQNLGAHPDAAQALLAAHRALPQHLEAACLLLEAAVAAYGIDEARPIYDEVSGRLPGTAVATAWASLLFDAGRYAEMPDGFVAKPVGTVAAWLKGRGEAPAWVGEREIIPSLTPPVYGEPKPTDAVVQVPGYLPYAATVRDATIFSKSTVIVTPDVNLLSDTMADERFGRFMAFNHDRRVVRNSERCLFDARAAGLMELDAAVMLSGWTTDYYGHWVPEYLCRLSYLENHPRFADLPIVVDAGMPVQHLEYLRLLVPNPVVELPREHALRCRELLVGGPSTFFPTHVVPNHQVPNDYMGGLPVGGFRYLQERVAAKLPPTGKGGRRLYLGRKSRNWRRVVNEDEIGEALAAEGFEILFPETMSFEDQVRMYQEASVVVAPGGSAVLNAIFARPDFRFVILSQRNLFNWSTYYGLMRELGYEMTMLCGEQNNDEKHSDFEIPVSQVLQAVAG